MTEFENPEARRIQSPEQQEGERREPQQEDPRPIETVESLDKKIAGIDERIGDYTASIEDTSKKLTQTRGELSLPPMTTEAPSITQSRETVARLDVAKQGLVAQREALGGDETAHERPGRLKDDPRFRELWDATPLQMVPKAFEVHERVVETLFRERYPEDAATYDALAQEEYQKEQQLAQEQRQNAEARKVTDQRAARETSEARKARELEMDRQTVTLDTNLVAEVHAEKATRNAADTQRRAENETYLKWMEAHPDDAPEDYFDQKLETDSVDVAVRSEGDVSDNENRTSGDRFAEMRARQATRLEQLRRSDITPEEHQRVLDEYVAEAATISEMKPTSGSKSEQLKLESADNVEKESTGVDRVNLERNLGNMWAEAGLTQSPEIDTLRLQIQTATADDAKRLDEALSKAARMYARTRDSGILAQTLIDLSTNDGGNKPESSRASIGNDETRGVYSELGVTTPDIALDTQAPPIESKVSDATKILEQETSKQERTGNAIMQFAQSPELFLDRMKDSGADYSPKKGIKVLVDAFKSLYPDPSQRAERLQSIYAAYKTTQEAYQGKYPKKGGDYAANYASKQTAVGLPSNEANQLQNYIKEKLDVVKPGGSKFSFTTELVMTDFFRFLDNLNS